MRILFPVYVTAGNMLSPVYSSGFLKILTIYVQDLLFNSAMGKKINNQRRDLLFRGDIFV